MNRRKWTDATIERELRTLAAELGRMPTRRDMSDRGAAGLWSAMQRHGGVAAWKGRVCPPASAPSRADIERRAYFLALEQGGGDPVRHWLAAERELIGV